MKITIKGVPEEITALALMMQEQLIADKELVAEARTKEDAIKKLAKRIENGENIPMSIRILF